MAVIELAIVLVFLLLLTVGITEIGRAFWFYSAMQKATREGARYVSMQPWSGANPEAACKTLVQGDANSAGVPLNQINISCSWDKGGGWGSSDPPKYVAVAIENYRMPLLWLPVPIGPQPMVVPGPQPSVGLSIQTTMPYMDEAD